MQQDRLAIMIVNDVDQAHSVTVRMPGAGTRSLVRYDYFASDRPVDREGYPVPKEVMKEADLEHGVRVDLPSRGVLFLTTVPPDPR